MAITLSRSYVLDDVKTIPILDICSELGIRVEKKGRGYWCKMRPEKTASVILHPENNTYHDFGTNEHGSSIDFVSSVLSLSFAESVRFLGDTFGLEPESREDARKRHTIMSLTDYSRIGLYGDLATKNFTFPIQHFSIEKLYEIENKYKMSMNQLRKQHPKTYERILREKAIPFVVSQQNLYYLGVWNYYSLLKEMNHTYYFYDSEKTLAHFKDQITELERAEHALKKAALGTSLELPEPVIDDPQRIISHFLDDKLAFSIGTHSREGLRATVGKAPDAVSVQTVSHSAYLQTDMDDIPHAALMTKDHIDIYCATKDIEKAQERMGIKSNSFRHPSLDQRIEVAGEKRAGQSNLHAHQQEHMVR